MVNGRKKELRLTIVMIVAAVVLATGSGITIPTTIDIVFAYTKYQATAGTNDCGNGKLPMNILCQDVGSEIQGDRNDLNIIGLQTGGEMKPSGVKKITLNVIKEIICPTGFSDCPVPDNIL